MFAFNKFLFENRDRDELTASWEPRSNLNSEPSRDSVRCFWLSNYHVLHDFIVDLNL